MSVTNYTPKYDNGCKYSYSKLKDVIYLVSKDHTKNVYIDDGAAYIDGLTELPLRLNGFNISLKEESSLDERYKFQKTVTLSMHGYVNSSIFGGRYYVILESFDGTFWMVNVDFPSKLTYTFNLSKDTYQTDFTLASLSNFPTLRLVANFEAVSPPCLGFNVYGVDTLKLLEKDYCALDTVSGTVYTFGGNEFKDVEFLGDSCSLQEVFDGDKVTTTIQFDIAFDAYKSSWHYNLLEFLENLYSAIITPKGNDNTFFAGFNFGLQPSFTIQTQSQAGASDIITVTLIEASSHGSTAAYDWSEEQTTDTRWVYVKYVDDIPCYVCVSLGVAKYLVQQEVNQNGVPTGNYKVLEGYESEFPTLNIVGTFSSEQLFNNADCSGVSCEVNTNLPTTITYNSATCNTYSYSASCDWEVSGLASYMTVTPSSGNAGSAYTLSVCNTKTPTSSETSTFTVTAGDNVKVVNVVLTPDSSIINPTSVTINCLAQEVRFNFNPNCPITVTSIDSRLTYQITNSQLIVNVPRNYSTASGITWSITVKDCNNNTQTVQIIQDKTYERWVDTSDYLCDSGNSYVKQVRYTGTTSTDINTMTSEYRKGSLIQSGDSRCTSTQTRWTFNNHYYCIDGDKYKVEEEEVSTDGGTTWNTDGNTRVGEMVESASSFCEETVEYKWVLTDRWQCDSTPTKFKATYSGGTTYMALCDGNSTLTSGDTNPQGFANTAMTSADIGDCVTEIGYAAFYRCWYLMSVNIPDTVTTIGNGAFSGCEGLSRLNSDVDGVFNIPDTVTSIDGGAFLFCYGLRQIEIPSGITSIGSYTFKDCHGLTSVYLPDTVTNIGANAFQYCSSLTSIDIPNSVTSIGSWAFEYCTHLTSVTVNATTPPTLGNNAFYSTNNCPIYVPSASVDTYKAASGWSTYADRIQAIP